MLRWSSLVAVIAYLSYLNFPIYDFSLWWTKFSLIPDAVRISQVADECKQLSPNAIEPLQVVCDLTKSDDIRRLVQSTIDRFEKLDIVCANAGVFSSALIG